MTKYGLTTESTEKMNHEGDQEHEDLFSHGCFRSNSLSHKKAQKKLEISFCAFCGLNDVEMMKR
jgi:hypothetical protein